MKFSKIAQKGFTLIELIITIVIIGILAAVAIPKFQSLSSEADTGVVKGVAAAIASATSVNYAKTKAGTGGVAITACGDMTGAVLTGLADVPLGTTVTGGALTADGVSGGCTATLNGASASFAAYGASR